ncbi:hypothetical protein NLI96_g4563 [Meripilus lineatus]|uniref:non-specific serine/threonine protein kinase n=1 Tax=Meripilus lineatus TaxID=2056292 RepID=A0AAD5YEN0_9APHY|nr:hypothetical protein NLI96_g4563 [Physisporinus lineatus]
MPSLVKFKALLRRGKKVKSNTAAAAVKQPVSPPTRLIGCSIVNHNVSNCFEPNPHIDYTSLVVLASGMSVGDAEKYHFRLMDEGMHDSVVMSLRAPIGHGALAEFCQYLLHQGMQSGELNALLGFKCSRKEQSDYNLSDFSELPFASEYDFASYLASLPSPVLPTPVESTVVVDNFTIVSDIPLGAPAEEVITFVDSCGTLWEGEDSGTPAVPADITPSGDSFDSDASISWQLVCVTGNASTTVAPSSPPTSVAAPKLEDFVLEKKLGQGAFGTVFSAIHRRTGVRIALKAIPKAPLFGSDGRLFDSSDFRHRASIQLRSARDEFFALYRTLGQDRVLQLEAAFQNSGYFFLGTTLHPFGDVHGLLKRYDGGLPIDLAKSLAADIVIGLCALRQRGLIHRDMKPANLLMGQNGHLLISDLGLAFACPTHMSDLEKSLLSPFVLARREAHASEVTTGMCGTPLYTSPEMILRQPYSYAVDVWAFGVILFQMLIGGCPFYYPTGRGRSALDHAILSGDFDMSDEERAELNDPLAEDLIRFALATNPSARPTPEQLKEHPWFNDIDWDNHTRTPAPASWVPPPSVSSPPLDDPGLHASDDTSPESTLPYFSFLSTTLRGTGLPPIQQPSSTSHVELSDSMFDLGALVPSESPSSGLPSSSLDFSATPAIPQDVNSFASAISSGTFSAASGSPLPPVVPPISTRRPLHRRLVLGRVNAGYHLSISQSLGL